MKVSLIFTPIGVEDSNFDSQAIRDNSIGLIPPVSLLTVAGIFEQEGAQVNIVDMDAEALNYAETLERVLDFSPDLIGFSLSTYNFNELLKWIQKFKQDTNLPIIVGGPHVALYPDEIMTHQEIDFALVGEAEIPLPQFIHAFRNGKDFSEIKSIAFRKDGKVEIEKTRQTVKDINELPLPPLHLIQNSLYSNIMTRKKNFTAMLSARGCPYRCTFCDQKNPPYRWRSAESFVAEVKRNFEEFGIREFDVYDSTFTVNKKRVKEICNRLSVENLSVGWTIRSRVDSVNEEVLDALKIGGCHTVFYGIESSNPEILKLMKKDITLERIDHIIGYTKKIGLNALGYFMLGYPGETRKTLDATLDFALKLPLDYAQFTTLVPLPETEIYDYYLEHGMEDYWREFTLNPTSRPIPLLNVELTREELDQYVELAYRRFYLRPRIILKQIAQVRSFSNASRIMIGAKSILKKWAPWESRLGAGI